MGIYYNLPQPQVGMKMPAALEIVPNPPFAFPIRKETYALLMERWKTVPPEPPIKGKINAATPGWSVDDPMFTHPGRVGPEYFTVISTWVPGPPQPPRSPLLVPIPVSLINEPPYGIPNLSILRTIIEAWQPPPPQPQRNWNVNPTFYDVNNPPFPGLPVSFLNIIRLWQPPDPQPQRGRPTSAPPGWSIDNPPIFRPEKMFGLIRSWTPPDPQPQRGLPTSAPPGWSIDNPPIVSHATLDKIIKSWEEIFPLQRLPAKIIYVPPAVDNPPPFVRAWLSTIVKQWEQSREFRQEFKSRVTISYTPSGIWVSLDGITFYLE